MGCGVPIVDDIIDAVVDVVASIVNAIVDFVVSVVNVISKAFKSIGNLISKAWASIKEYIVEIVAVVLIIIAVIFQQYYLVPYISEYAGAITAAAYSAGITSSFGLMSVYWASYAIMYVVSGELLDGMTDMAISTMIGGVALSMLSYQREAANVGFMNSLLDGSIFDWLAGGENHNAVFAGGTLFSSTGMLERDTKMFGNIPSTYTDLTPLKREVFLNNFAGGNLFNGRFAGSSNYKPFNGIEMDISYF